MANEPTGRALAEAAARAMGWHKDEEFGNWIDTSGEIRGEPSFEWCEPMLAWLHERGTLTTVSDARECVAVHSASRLGEQMTASANGANLLEALQRLVVAVAAREAKP